jgi:hypothetical protein
MQPPNKKQKRLAGGPSPPLRPWEEAKQDIMGLIWSHLDLESLKLWIKALKSQFDLFKDNVAMRKVFYTVCSRQWVAIIERLRKINYDVVDSPKILPPLRDAGEELSCTELASWKKGTETKKTKKQLLWRLMKEKELANCQRQLAYGNETHVDPLSLPDWPSQVDLEGFGYTTGATNAKIIEQIQHQFSDNKKSRVMNTWRTINGKCITIAYLTQMVFFWGSEEAFVTKGELNLWESWARACSN